MDWFKTDDLTILLGVGLVAVYALSKFLKPQSLVHPLLLGHQSDVGRVRLPGESAVYRNYATGIMGRLPERPHPEVRLLTDLVRDDFVAPRTLWSETITNAQLKERAEALGTGMLLLTRLEPRLTTALVLLDDSLEFIITELALASNSIMSLTLTSLSLLDSALETHSPTGLIVPYRFLDLILAQDTDLTPVVIVLGAEKGTRLNARRPTVKVVRWEDLEAQGRTMEKPSVPPPDPREFFNTTCYADVNGNRCDIGFTHANLTAGVTACHLLFPLTGPLSPSDAVFSVHGMSGAFGRVIAYTALYEGSSFESYPPRLASGEAEIAETCRLLTACQSSTISPTLLFITPEDLKGLGGAILETARSNPLFGLAWRHKMSDFREGFVTKKTFWDNCVLKGARTKELGKLEESLRGIAVSQGQLEATVLERARIALSIPVISVHTHAAVCGPVMASHPLDLQCFPGDAEPHITVGHVGPPACNVEIKLVGVLDTSVEKGGDPAGKVLVRGPSVGRPLPGTLGQDGEGWVHTGETARVQTNGTFKV